MHPWSKRAPEEANLFNPAFCATLLTKSAGEFTTKTQRALPFALGFLVLPVVLHQSTRSALPASTVTSLLPWIQEHREQLVDFSLRVQRLRDITREAILFGLQHDMLAISEHGEIMVGPKRTIVSDRRTGLFTDEARRCLDRAGFVGRWFAVAGTTATIYASWGVAP